MSTSALIRDVLQAKKARGEKVGGRQAYGAAEGVDDARNEAERAILDCVRERRAAGLSIRAIADELASLGHRTRRGGYIAPTQVARIVRESCAA